MADTLGDHLDSRDAELFVGRGSEVDRLSALLDDDPDSSIAYVHGPGGVGKSALLRALSRRACERRWITHRVDGRDLGPSTEDLDRTVDAIEADMPTLLVLDSFEQMATLAPHLRRHVLPDLPTTTRVVIGSRRPPDPGWRSDGWDGVMTVMPIATLDSRTAERLLRARGVTDPTSIRTLLQWADGLPLALTIAADAASTDPSFATSGDIDAELAVALLGELVDDDDLGRFAASGVAVAAIAKRVDAPMLAAVLPDAGPEGFDWLARRGFVEHQGDAVVLHERAAAAVRWQMRRQYPEREHVLRRRIVEHLVERIHHGEPWLVVDLPFLIHDPAVRYALGAESREITSDRVRDGDLRALRLATERRGQPWFDTLDRWIEDAPDHVIVLRSAHDVAGAGVCLTPGWAPPWSDDDPVTASWFAAMRTGALPGHDAVYLRASVDVFSPPGSTESDVSKVGNAELLRRTRTPNPRWMVVLVAEGNDRMDAFLDAMGYRTVDGLGYRESGASFRTVVRDLGPGGLAGAMRELVLADIGITAPTPADCTHDVREALRAFHDPVVLARSALAHGASVDARADSVRSLIAANLDVAFGVDGDGRLQRSVLELGYLDPAGGHTVAAQALHLSRSTYFRRLARATDQLAQVITS
ncbi:MAG: AAA family ATPase [Acidimicrobiales bacterium]